MFCFTTSSHRFIGRPVVLVHRYVKTFSFNIVLRLARDSTIYNTSGTVFGAICYVMDPKTASNERVAYAVNPRYTAYPPQHFQL
ncbi:unnamed protein product [Euphydryas editha]|uniref:Uncharacterized protein n=1 Tax=Euphydryas editha TaxID=104508 RepID=A0AAU9UEY9_EUPED|nr:unnamed protein product [Euphydryas editha]